MMYGLFYAMAYRDIEHFCYNATHSFDIDYFHMLKRRFIAIILSSVHFIDAL